MTLQTLIENVLAENHLLQHKLNIIHKICEQVEHNQVSSTYAIISVKELSNASPKSITEKPIEYLPHSDSGRSSGS